MIIMNKVAFTTSIPIEILFAAGKTPVDLNNIFITSKRAQELLDLAEEAGYPRSTCGWIKGLYSVALENNDLEAVIAVMHGDCSNTQALMETLQMKDIKIIPFAFPFDRDQEMLEAQMKKLMKYFNVTIDEVEKVNRQLNQIREKCRELDELTWKDNLITGVENHFYLVSASDFWGDPIFYEKELDKLLQVAKLREGIKDEVRLAYIGVPPIFTNFYEVIESMGARVVFNEVQRQFSMPYESDNINEQYIRYTYPYGAFARLEDIIPELNKRNVDGIIHYTQTFCFRQIEDLIYREKIKLPFLTVEGDKPGRVDARTKMRLEAFINMLKP